MVLEILRYREKDEMGLSWWIVRRKDGDKIAFPGKRELRKLFLKAIPRASFFKTEGPCRDRFLYVGMQIGLKPTERQAFLEALEKAI